VRHPLPNGESAARGSLGRCGCHAIGGSSRAWDLKAGPLPLAASSLEPIGCTQSGDHTPVHQDLPWPTWCARNMLLHET
jgi:hypothetical protein